MSATNAHLVRMANQIAANLAVQGDEAAIETTAQHIRLYWDPRMRAEIIRAGNTGLSELARAAVTRLAT